MGARRRGLVKGVDTTSILQRLANEYAAHQQRAEASEPQLWGIWYRAKTALAVDAPSRATATEALQDLVTPYVPIVDGQPTSIGSLPCAAGSSLCRFNRKGKCFDGVLCRFSHIPDAVPRKEKRKKKTPESPQQMCRPPVGQGMLSSYPRRMTNTRLPRLPTVPELPETAEVSAR
jgi:hypothetical protein